MSQIEMHELRKGDVIAYGSSTAAVIRANRCSVTLRSADYFSGNSFNVRFDELAPGTVARLVKP